MFRPEIYQTIYLLVVIFFSLVYFYRYKLMTKDSLEVSAYDSPTGWLVMVVVILLVGLRPIDPFFADMTAYQGLYDRSNGVFKFDWHAINLVWDNWNNWMAAVRFPPVWYYLMIAAIYFGFIHLTCKKLFPNDIAAAFVMYLAAFSTFAYGTNGLKAGTAAVTFLLGIAHRDNLKLCIPLVLLSFGLHHSMELPVVAFFITLLYRNPKPFFFLWVICSLFAMFHVTFFQGIFAGMTDEHGASYLLADESHIGGRGGLRLDFMLYSAMPVVVGWVAVVRKGISSKMYNTLLSLYLITNSVWMLCMYASYTNRIAYLSWLMYPIVLAYPILNEDWGPRRYSFFKFIAYLHLGFTLYMHFFYYGHSL